jgi:hypothetical protein
MGGTKERDSEGDELKINTSHDYHDVDFQFVTLLPLLHSSHFLLFTDYTYDLYKQAKRQRLDDSRQHINHHVTTNALGGMNGYQDGNGDSRRISSPWCVLFYFILFN